MKSEIARIGKLIDLHESENRVLYTKCPGCEKCIEIQQIRKKLVEPKKSKPKIVEKKIKKPFLTKDEYLNYHNSGLNDKEIAKKIGLSANTIYKYKSKWGIITRSKTEILAARKKEYIKLKKQGLSDKQIALNLGVVVETLYVYKRRWGLSRKRKPKN